MHKRFLQNIIKVISNGAYKLALNTTEKGATNDCLFLLWYEPDFIEEMIARK